MDLVHLEERCWLEVSHRSPRLGLYLPPPRLLPPGSFTGRRWTLGNYSGPQGAFEDHTPWIPEGEEGICCQCAQPGVGDCESSVCACCAEACHAECLIAQVDVRSRDVDMERLSAGCLRKNAQHRGPIGHVKGRWSGVTRLELTPKGERAARAKEQGVLPSEVCSAPSCLATFSHHCHVRALSST